MKNSNAMELEGFKRSIKNFEKNGIQITELVTDRHLQIQKYVREDKPHIKHYYDGWHVVKGRVNICFILHFL